MRTITLGLMLVVPLLMAVQSPSGVSGLIVEEIAADSPAGRAGLKVGDLVLTWDSKPLSSPYALQAAVQNTFGKGEVMLRIRRGEETLTLTLPPGRLGIQVRPVIPPAALALYEEGKTAQKAKKTDEIISRWTAAARIAEEAGDRSAAAWLHGRVGGIREENRQWKEAGSAHLAAWMLLKENPDAAAKSRTLSVLGRCSQSLNNFPEARRWYDQAVQIDIAAGNDMWAAGNLVGVGSAAFMRGDLDAAQDSFSRALTIRERLTPNSLDVAGSLNNLGSVAYRRGALETAQDYYSRALAIRERLAPNSLEHAASMSNLAAVIHDRGDLTTAQDYHNRALEIRERLAPNSLDVAVSLTNLGNIVSDRGDLQTAQDYHSRALAIRERLAPNSLEVAASLNNLGALAQDGGDLQAAQDYYTRALAIRERLAPNSLTVASSLNNLGSVAYRRGNLEIAQEYHTRALGIRERLAPNSLSVASSLNNLGNVAQTRGDLEGAQEYYNRALVIRERVAPDTSDVAGSLTGLGNVAWHRRNFQAAHDYHSRALAIRQRLAPNSLDIAASLTNLGLVARDRGDLQTAQDYHARALTIEERLAPNSLNVAASFMNLGNIAYDRGDLQSAQVYFVRALAIKEGLAPNSLGVADAITNLGELAFRQRRYSDARSLLTRAADIVEGHRHEIPSTDTRAFLVAKHSELYFELLRSNLALNDLPAAFATIERARARSLLDLLAEARIDVEQGIDPSLKQRDQATQARIASIQSQLIQIHSKAAPDKNKIAQMEDQLKQVEREREQLKMEIRQNHPRYAELQYPAPLGLRAIQDLLDPQTALLEYALGEDRSFLFVVTRTDSFSVELPPASSLAERVKQLRDTLISRPQRSTLPAYIEQARSLHKLMIEPAQKSLAGKQHLIIVPDGILHYLPFEVLLSSGDKRSLDAVVPQRWPYLVRDYALSYVSSATVLASLHRSRQARPVQQKVFLAYADPAYGAAGLTEGDPVKSAVRSAFGESTPWRLERLPESRAEANRIAALYPQEKVRIFLQQEAREENVKVNAELGQYRFVHFAAHGLLNESKPQFSGLVLSLPNRQSSTVARQSEDGLLQVYEIFNLKLNADLVVLSACETGLGKEVKGEGLVGLTRAFLYAGTRSVIVSLWKVSDRSTSELMVSFYQHLKAGAVSKAEALRQAQLKLISDGRYAHPYYWAPFILVGESR